MDESETATACDAAQGRHGARGAMVTLLDVSADDERLLAAFDVLLPATQGHVLQRLSVAACYAVVARGDRAESLKGGKLPEHIARAFLLRCMPAVPDGHVPDDDFRARYLDHVVPMLERRCVELVLGSAREDAARAAELLDDLTECAERAEHHHCEGWWFLEVTRVLNFIADWRENFCANLARESARPA